MKLKSYDFIEINFLKLISMLIKLIIYLFFFFLFCFNFSIFFMAKYEPVADSRVVIITNIAISIYFSVFILLSPIYFIINLFDVDNI